MISIRAAVGDMSCGVALCNGVTLSGSDLSIKTYVRPLDISIYIFPLNFTRHLQNTQGRKSFLVVMPIHLRSLVSIFPSKMSPKSMFKCQTDAGEPVKSTLGYLQAVCKLKNEERNKSNESCPPNLFTKCRCRRGGGGGIDRGSVREGAFGLGAKRDYAR